MSEGFTFIGAIAGHENETVIAAAVSAGVVLFGGKLALDQLRKSKMPVIPDSSLTVRNLFELIAQFILVLGDNVLGASNRKYLPFCTTIFVTLLTMNLMGLIPGFLTATSSFSFNLGMAGIVFIMYHWWGVRELGLWQYAKHFFGPIWCLAWFMLAVEVVGHLFRPMTLSLRLFGNMSADHTVLAVITNLSKGAYLPFPVAFYLLGTLVCVVQAFVFTLLTMIYIRLAVSHEEHGDEDGHH